MKNDSQLKLEIIANIEGLKNIDSVLVLKDGRIAIGTQCLKIYDKKTFNFDFEISIKEYLDKDNNDFTFKNIMYLKNGDILINNRRKIFFIIKIIDNEKKFNILEKFESKCTFPINARICELSNNSISTIGVYYDIEFFSKNENNKYYSIKIIKNAHKRDGYKTLIEIPNNRIMSFSGKLREFKVWNLNNYECIFTGEISEPECYGNKIDLILNRYVLIESLGGLTIIDIDNNYNQYIALKYAQIYSMMRLNEKEYLILTTKNNIEKIAFDVDKLEFKIENSKYFLSKNGYSLGHILLKLRDNTYITYFQKNEYSSSEGCDTPLLIFKYNIN